MIPPRHTLERNLEWSGALLLLSLNLGILARLFVLVTALVPHG